MWKKKSEWMIRRACLDRYLDGYDDGIAFVIGLTVIHLERFSWVMYVEMLWAVLRTALVHKEKSPGTLTVE